MSIPGADIKSMTWWPDLLALIRAGSSIETIIGRFSSSILMSLDREKLFQIIEQELEDGKNTGDLSWSALIAKAILLAIAPAVDDELLDRYEVLLRKKDYAGNFLFWINAFVPQLRNKKELQKREAEFSQRYPALIG